MSDTETSESTAAETSTTASAGAKRTRGTGFPSLPLLDAVALVKQIAGFGPSHNNASLASALGHSTPNSGPYRSKIATLKDFGLLTGRGDELTVTPLAQELANPGFDSNPAADLRAAFENCTIFMKVIGELTKGQSIPIAGLANHAMNRHGIGPQSKDVFATVFARSGEAAGLLEIDGDKIRVLDPVERAVNEMVFTTEITANASEAPLAPIRDTPTENLQRQGEASHAIVHHSWSIDGGVIRFVIEGSKTLPASAYTVIGKVIEAGDDLAQLLAPAESTDDAAADSD